MDKNQVSASRGCKNRRKSYSLIERDTLAGSVPVARLLKNKRAAGYAPPIFLTPELVHPKIEEVHLLHLLILYRL